MKQRCQQFACHWEVSSCRFACQSHHAARREMRANEYSAMQEAGKPRSADRYLRLPCCALQLATRARRPFSRGPDLSAESTETTSIHALIYWMSCCHRPRSDRRFGVLMSLCNDARRRASRSAAAIRSGCAASSTNRRTCDREAPAASRDLRRRPTAGVPARSNAMIAAPSIADHAPSPTRHMHAP